MNIDNGIMIQQYEFNKNKIFDILRRLLRISSILFLTPRHFVSLRHSIEIYVEFYDISKYILSK